MEPEKQSARRRRLVVSVILGVVCLGLGFWVLRWIRNQTAPTIPIVPSGAQEVTATDQSAVVRQPAQALPLEGVSLQQATFKLKAARSEEEARHILVQLRATLGGMPPELASQTIQQWLKAGTDVATHIPFALGTGGVLLDAPTLRTFLLDYLERLDPAAAVQVGQSILNRMDSSDEWCLALRSVATLLPSAQNRPLLETKLRQLLSYEPWLQEPSVGYLESFDVAVYLGGNALIPELTRLLRSPNPQSVLHAAFLAMDRLVQADPTPICSVLLSDFSLMQGREALRAGFFARTDVSQSAQRDLVENYLLNPALTATELDTFADSFPNENQMISNNLLTRTRTRTGSEIRSRDLATVQVVDAWMRDPRFKTITPQLQVIRQRLETFVTSPATSQPRLAPPKTR